MNVVVSMGKDGAYWFANDVVLHAPVLPVKVKGTVGAGDSMVAGIACGLQKGMSFAETFQLATALSQCCVQYGTIDEIVESEVKFTMEKIQIRTL